MTNALKALGVLGLCLSAGWSQHLRAQGALKPESFRVQRVSLDLSIDYAKQELGGTADYRVENWTTSPARAVSMLLGRLMEVSNVRDSAGRPLKFSQRVARFRDEPLRQVNQIQVHLPHAIAPSAHTTVSVSYRGNLVGYTEVGWLYVLDHIDTTFTILREEALAFPEIGGLSREANMMQPRRDFDYSVSVRVPSRFRAATGGVATQLRHADGTTTWHFESEGQSPFLNVAIAPYDTLKGRGIHVSYFPADSTGAHHIGTAANHAIDTLTAWFGPLRKPPHLSIAEIPDGWGSQASLVGGIIQTASAFRDPRRVGELYHELSHLWNARDSDRDTPRWNEGLASFLQDELREQIDGWTGRAAADSALVARLRRNIAADERLTTVPMIRYGARDMTGYSYSVGNLFFAVMHAMIGQAAFNRVMGGYYQRYAEGGNTAEFVAFAKQTSPVDLSGLFDDWLNTQRWTERIRTTSSVSELAALYRK